MLTEQIFKKLCAVIPGGVNSPVRSCYAVGQLPLIAASATQDQIIDIEGRSFLDYCMSWGALIHGHANPDILNEIHSQLLKGTSYGTTSLIEERLAHKVCSMLPAVEMVRFVSSGTEATMSAVRLARGFTNRDLIIKFSGHYHGHADFFLVQAGSGVMNLSASSSKGIPADIVKNTICLPFNDVEAVRSALREQGDRIACVILEPITGNIGVVPATQGFIKMLQEETARLGILLIFDEVITGFRVAKGGAQALYGIKPDLTCLGKIVGGGLPAAAFGGKKEIMEWLAPLGPVYQAGTLSGNPLAMAAGIKALEMLDKPDFYPHMQHKTDIILDPLRKFIEERSINACIQSSGSMFTIFLGKRCVNNAEDAKNCDKKQFAELFRFLYAKGIYIPPLQQEAWFISTAHTDAHLKATVETVMEFFESVK